MRGMGVNKLHDQEWTTYLLSGLSTSQPFLTEDVTDLREKGQQQPGIMKSPSPGSPVLGRAQAFLLHMSKGWEYMFCASTHMFSERTTPNQKMTKH